MTISPYTTEARLERIELLLEDIMSELTDLVAQVAAVKTVEDSAVLAINALVSRLDALVQNATDLAELKAAVTAETAALRENAVPLASAVAAVPVG